MRLLFNYLPTVNFFLVIAFALNSQGQETKEPSIDTVGGFTPTAAIELLLSEPLDEAVTYGKDDKGPICEYRSKSLRFLVRYCDPARKGRIAGTIIHNESRQAVTYFIQLKEDAEFDFKNEYLPEHFSWRTFNFYYPFVDYNSNEKPNPPICETGFFIPPSPDPMRPATRQNFSRCDNQQAGSYQAKWRASGEKLRDEPNHKLLVELTKLHISKFSTPPAPAK